MTRILSETAVDECLDLTALLPVLREAFVKQGQGDVERPERPHFPVGAGLADPDLPDADPADPLGTGLVMPAYVHGAAHYATKLASVHEGNDTRGLPTVNAQVALTEADTGQPAAFLAGTLLTSARTGCIGGLAAADLATDEPVRLGVLGAGTQARWQTKAIAAATDLESVDIYSPSDSKHECASDLRDALDDGVTVQTADSPEDCVSGATVVVTATTATEPVFPGSALEPGTLVVAVGAYTAEMQELDSETVERAGRVFADVPAEVAEIGDVAATDLKEEDLIPLSSVLAGETGRESNDEILVVESVGTAVLDAAAAEHVFEEALERDVGVDVEL